MKREQALLKNTVILTFGKFVPQLFSLITLPIITASLSTSEYGNYDLILTLVALVLPIVTLQIQSAAFRFLLDARDDEEKAGKIITNIMCFTIPASLLALVIMFFLLRTLSGSTRILVCLYFFADILTITFGQVARGLANNLAYAMSAILLSGVNMIVIVAALVYGRMGLNGVLLAAVVANIITVLYLIYKIHLFQYIRFNLVSGEYIKKMLNYSWPMVPNNLSTWVLNISDRLIITAFLGVESNAIYAIANKIPSILNMARSTFVMAWQENAALVSKDEDATKYYSQMFDMIFSLVIGLTAVLIAMTPIMFYVLIRGDYNDSYYQMPILFVGVFFGCISSFQGGIYIAYMKTRDVGLTTMFAAGTNLVIDLLLVKRIGIAAGSISTLISYFILFMYRMFDVWKIQKIEYNYKKMLLQITIITIMCVICFQRNGILNIVNGILGVVFALLVNYKMVKGVIKTILHKKKV